MAYINGEFEHEYHEIKIYVLEPTKGENGFKKGMKISIDWDNSVNCDLSEFRNILKWMTEKLDFIENNFTKSGKAKTIYVKG